MKKLLFKIPYYFLVTGVAVMGLLLLATLIPIPGNFKVKIVKSGSMEPYIRTGGIVAIRPAASYNVGDVITFGADTKTQIPTTHRIVEVNGSGSAKTFVTKGDANDAVDPKETKLSEVSGKVFATVPYLGYILDFAKKPLGFALLVGIPAAIVILDELVKIWKEVRKMRRRKEREIGIGEPPSPESRRGGQGGEVYSRSRVLDLRPKRNFDSKMGFMQVQAPRASGFSTRAFSVVLMILAPLFGLSQIGGTISYYNESEQSLGNILQASDDYGLPESDTLSKLSESETLLETASTSEALSLEEPPDTESPPPTPEGVGEPTESVGSAGGLEEENVDNKNSNEPAKTTEVAQAGEQVEENEAGLETNKEITMDDENKKKDEVVEGGEVATPEETPSEAPSESAEPASEPAPSE